MNTERKVHYESLIRLLAKHGETDQQIKKCFFIKVGGLALKREKDETGANNASALMKEIAAKLVKAVSAHPNVSPSSSLGSTSIAMMTMGDPEFLFSDRHFLFHLTLPKQRLRYPEWSSAGDMEDFYAIYTGSLFAVYTEILDYPEHSGIGQEFRELLQTQIDKESSLRCTHLAPTPLHPDIYLIIRRSSDATKRSRPIVFEERGNLLVVFEDADVADAKDPELVDAFFSSIEHYILSFYRERLSGAQADEVTRKVLDLFTGLSQTSQRIFANPAWRVLRSRRLSRAAAGQLSSIYESLVLHESLILGFHKSREQFLGSVAEHSVLSVINDYFRRELSDEAEVPKSLTPALTYYESQLSLSLNIRTLLLATIAGAILGAVLGSGLTWSLAHFGH